MKTNIDVVFEKMNQLDICMPNNEGVTTEELSGFVELQRSNVSALLNQLVKEGKVEKIKGKPVHFRLVTKETNKNFESLIGYDSSLKNAIETAKASILYPKQLTNVLVLGKDGCGKSTFVQAMYDFAVKNYIFKKNAQYLKINCRQYMESESELDEILFDKKSSKYLFNSWTSGLLFINHIEKLRPNQKRQLVELIENESLTASKDKRIIVCGYDESTFSEEKEWYMQKFTIVISLPALNQRSFEERFLLIGLFLKQQIDIINKKLIINPSLMKSLLLYDCDNNIKNLQNDLNSGIAKGYGRNKDSDILVLTFSDFPVKVRNGYLFYQKNRFKIDQLVKDACAYCIDKKHSTFYVEQNKKELELSDDNSFKNETEENIPEFLGGNLDTYLSNINDQSINLDQISKVCDKEILLEVQDFLSEIQKETGRIFSATVYYSLCLHLNSLLERRESQQKFSMQQALEIMDKHKKEYQYSLNFCAKFEKKHGLKLPIDEVIFVTLFLINESFVNDDCDQVVILIAMHGYGTAQSLVRTAQTLVKSNNIYGFDLNLNEDISIAYQKLKDKILSINRNCGVLVIYDMGSFETMLQMISLETNIPIRTIEMPITLAAIDCSRKAEFGTSIDEIYISVQESLNRHKKKEDTIYSKADTKKAIITLCMSGEGGAKRIREYLISNCKITDIQIIPLAISNRNELLNRLTEINSRQKIVCIIGSYNPQIYGIRFINLEELFSTDSSDIKELLFNEISQIDDIDYIQVFSYIENQFKHLNTQKIKNPLFECVNKLSTQFHLSKSVSFGLLMHIASMLNGLVEMSDMPVYSNSKKILSTYSTDAKKIKTYLNKLEMICNVDCGEDEIAGIISIIRKL